MELMSLVCYGCESTASEDIFFNSETKRPRIGKCDHSLCDKCLRKCIKCAICKENFIDIDKINYMALGILENYEENFIERYRNWWKNSEDLTNGMCGKCHEFSEKPLRICVQCNGSEKKTMWKCLWVSEGNVRLSLLNMEHLMLLKSRLWCANCALETRTEQNESFQKREATKNDPRTRNSILNTYQCEEGHKSVRLVDIEHSAIDIRRATSEVISKFLWKVVEEKGKNLEKMCKLRHLRLLRTCEVLIHLAKLHFPFKSEENKFEPIGFSNTWHWTHRRQFSRVSKYFEGLTYQVDPDEKFIDRLIESFEFQWNELQKITKKCDCSEKWKNMKSSKLGNQMEKSFVEMIDNCNLEAIIDNCPINWPTSLEAKKRLETCKPFEGFDLPTIFCWNSRFEGPCSIFDKNDHKPCKCPRCSNSTCFSCLKSNFLLDCPICNWSFQQSFPKGILNLSAVYTFDEQVLELVDFYKNNYLEFFEKWWNADVAPGEGYCMNCRSYTTELEICTYCELAEEESALYYNSSGDLSLRLAGISNFAVRWQCSECKPRLEANWEHSNCDTSSNREYVRGCNHRFNYNCSSMTNCAESVISLKKIKNSEFLWKAATWHIAKKILKDEELVEITEKYLEAVFGEGEESTDLAVEIEELIQKLKNF